MPRAAELPRDADDLVGRLALAENDLGDALPQCAMMIDRGVTQVGEREIAQLGGRGFDARRAGAHALEEILEALNSPRVSRMHAASR